MHYINDVEVRGLYSNQNPAKIQAEEETTNLLCFGWLPILLLYWTKWRTNPALN